MENELPEGAIEVLVEETPAAGAEPVQQGTEQPQGGGGNRSGFEQRIAQLTARRHEAERGESEQRDRADRLEAELARQRTQIDALAGRQSATESNVQQDYAARERAIQLHDIDGKITRLASDKATALEAGEFQKAAAVDVEIAQALIEKRDLEASAERSRSQQTRQTQPPPQTQPQDPKLAAFLARNQDWFNVDAAKTAKAWALHAEIKQANPSMIGSDEYWRRIESSVRNPDSGQRQVPPLSNGGAGTSNGSGGAGPTRIVLTPEQAATARGLKLSPEQYARGLLEARQKGELP